MPDNNTINQKITLRLIYKSPRFQQLRQNNIKYAYFSSNLEYPMAKYHRVLRKRILDLPKKDSINKISYSLSSSKLENDHFMRFITNLSSSLQHLSLKVTLDNFETRKILNKILKTCPRAKSLDLVISVPSEQTQLPLKISCSHKIFQKFHLHIMEPLWNSL